MDKDKRLSHHYVWLFALVAVVGGVGLSFATAGAGVKVSAAVFFAFVGLMAFLGAYLTRATALQAIGPFLLASGALGAIYYAIARSLVTAAADSVGVGAHAGGAASAFGAVVAFLITFDALAASVGGGLFGLKLRAVKSPAELIRRPA